MSKNNIFLGDGHPVYAGDASDAIAKRGAVITFTHIPTGEERVVWDCSGLHMAHPIETAGSSVRSTCPIKPISRTNLVSTARQL